MLDVERRHKMIRLLRARGVMTKQALLQELETSPASFKRDLAFLRDRSGAVIEFDRERGGYVLHESKGSDPDYLPGLWFTAGEIHGLLTLYRLAESLEPSLLGEHLQPIVAKLEKQLAGEGVASETLTDRIRVLHMAHREPVPAVFEACSIAVLGRRRLKVCHHHRGRDERLVRELSPQRLVHYRDNWYLDAWCHLRQDLRSFSLDALETATLLDEPAKPVSTYKLDRHFGSSYGIFAGTADKDARVRFTAERARWVAKERWHPNQMLELDGQGGVILSIPYHRPEELLMDILRHGAHAEVLSPPELRAEIASMLKAAAARY
jgi:predicted DNA-binding transcriptional regulator YafY